MKPAKPESVIRIRFKPAENLSCSVAYCQGKPYINVDESTFCKAHSSLEVKRRLKYMAIDKDDIPF
jgi:hypothetical protein